MSGSPENYTTSYPATAESVPRSRAELTEFASRAGARGSRLDAIRLAASEAVTNAVVHAYEGCSKPGPAVQVCASTIGEDLWILVADDGEGLRRRTVQSSGLGLGLGLIAELTDDFQLVNRGGGGTELRMCFKLGGGDAAPERHGRGSLFAAASPA
jgi:anti-sigma regulatory factor (Ser/Thr protein kinase)